mmetsp:Transcript_60193/g.136086  ORF Transcript_60193/g.136086 Transcript_60193/m.136086 type:complete len:271 (-) Transcript_60193:428-1240(-)
MAESIFTRETLTERDIAIAAALSWALFLGLAFWGWMIDDDVIYSPKRPGASAIPKRKRMASAISLGNSLICTVLGWIYLFGKYPKGLMGIPYFPMGADAKELVFYGRDDFGVLCCVLFGTAMVSDLVVGLAFYKRHLGFLTCYFHHSMFSWLMVFCITTNGLVTSTATPFAPSFVIALIEEVPTFILNLGTVFPWARSDLGFGVSFFVLRILWHSFYLGYCIYHGVYSQIIFLYVLTWAIHVSWFWAWLNGQGRKCLPLWLLPKSNSKKL